MPETSTDESLIQTPPKQALGAYSVAPSAPIPTQENILLTRMSDTRKSETTLSTPNQATENPLDTPKPTRASITGVLSPEETVFKLKATALEKQVADLNAQVEELIKKIKDEKEAGKKAVLKATIESEGNAEKLQSLVQMQREELLNLKHALEVEETNSKGKDGRIHELELALRENDSLLATFGNNSYFAQNTQTGEEQSEAGQGLAKTKEATAKILKSAEEKNDKSLQLLQELLTELEATTDCALIKKEIDDIASSLSPEHLDESPLDATSANSSPVKEELSGLSEKEASVQTTQEAVGTEVAVVPVDENLALDAAPNISQVDQVEKAPPLSEVTEGGGATINQEEEPQTVNLEETVPTEQKGSEADTAPEIKDEEAPTSENISTTIQAESPSETESATPPLEELKATSAFLSQETIRALFAAAPIATPESYLVSPFGFLSKETASRDLASFPESLITALETKNPYSLIDQALYDTYKDTSASDIYLSSGNFSGTIDERVKMSAFIRSLLGFFLPNHIASLPDNEAKTILSTATVSTLWLTTCELYAEEKTVSSSSLTSLIMEQLGLTAAAIEEKQATLREIVDIVYAKFLNPLLGKKASATSDEDTVSPILEALRKAFEMDEKELKQNQSHNYQFFMIALKNFLLREKESKEIIKLFEEAREETLSALTENDAQKAEILRLFERAKEEAKA